MKDWLKNVLMALAFILALLGGALGVMLLVIWIAALFEINVGFVGIGVLGIVFAIFFGTGAYLEERRGS